MDNVRILQQQRIHCWNGELPREVKLTLLTSRDPRSNEFEEFCSVLTHFAPKVTIGREAQGQNPPAVCIGKALRYYAIPWGRELDPFLQAIALRQSGLVGKVFHLERLSWPTQLKLYIDSDCPVCPHAVRQLTPFPLANELIQLEIVDCRLFPEMAQADSIQAVPTLALEKMRWMGSLRVREIAAMIVQRDPSRLSAQSLLEMVEQKQAVRIAEMMLASQKIFPAVCRFLCEERWEVRLGAMVALEEVGSLDRALFARASGELWKAFEQAGPRMKGDIAYLLGNTGDIGLVPNLKASLAGCHPDAREAIEEALEKLESGETIF